MTPDIKIPRYELIREIGSGGMAKVYLATQEGLDREVAVKVLRQSLGGGNEEFRKRFQYEGRMLAQLEHENIVKIYDIGAAGDAVYMVMEYLRGGTLNQRMANGDLNLGEVIKVCAKIGLALQVAHNKQIIHRDLKPSNIMFRDAVTPVLTDFGIARKIDMEMTMTATGMMIGTPKYMSPEQLQGKPVDARSDIYSLGLMFYRLLTGNLPFQASDHIALALQQVQEKPPPLPEELSELQPVLDLMLAKDPDDRYPSCLDFCNHLRTISLTGEEYSTELSSATRLFSSDLYSGSFSTSRTSGSSVEHTQESSISRAVSSLSTAVSKVFEKKRNRYISLGLAGLALVIVLLAGQFFSHGLSEVEINRLEAELDMFDGYLKVDQVVSPPGRNAAESLQRMLAISPDYSKVRDAAERLAEAYLGLAYDRYNDGDLDAALDWVEQGAVIDPDNDDLDDLRLALEGEIESRDRLLKIQDLLQAGNQALADQRLIRPSGESAYDKFQEVRALDLQNAEAEAGLSTIQRMLAERVREAWASEGREAAQAVVSEGLAVFAQSGLLLDLQNEIRQEEARELEEAEFNRLLSEAERQIAAGWMVEPPGDNALDSLAAARELRPQSTEVAIGLKKIADHFLAQSTALFEAGDYEGSLLASADGIRAMPGNAALLDIQSRATAQLDEYNRAIQSALQKAKRFVAEGQLIPGQPGLASAGENAFAAFNEVLAIDSGNTLAMAGLAELPARLEDAVVSLESAGSFDQAIALLRAGQDVLADGTAGYPDWIRNLEAKRAEQVALRQVQQRLASLDERIAERPLTVERIDAIGAELLELSRDDRYQVEVSDRLSRFITAISDSADELSAGGDDPGALTLLDRSLVLYEANPELAAMRSRVVARQQDRVEQERARIAAMSGILALDAVPYARVVEVRNGASEPQALPDFAETPLSLNLVEGSYTVVFQTPGGETVQREVRVTRQQVELLRLESVSMNADFYFERSGW